MKKEEKTAAVLASAKNINGIPAYPATFGLIFWLSDVRKNPVMRGAELKLGDLAELCWAFTLPSQEVERMTPKQRAEAVKAFMHSMTQESFSAFQKHAETEILRYFQTAATPKKPQGRDIRPKARPRKQ